MLALGHGLLPHPRHESEHRLRVAYRLQSLRIDLGFRFVHAGDAAMEHERIDSEAIGADRLGVCATGVEVLEILVPSLREREPLPRRWHCRFLRLTVRPGVDTLRQSDPLLSRLDQGKGIVGSFRQLVPCPSAIVLVPENELRPRHVDRAWSCFLISVLPLDVVSDINADSMIGWFHIWLPFEPRSQILSFSGKVGSCGKKFFRYPASY